MPMPGTSFEHRLAAHCESGTTWSILRHHGLDVSEAMVFGIASGIFFGYFWFRNFSFPRVVNRSRPGSILKLAPKRLGLRSYARRFRSPAKGMAALDRLLDEGQVVSLQVNMFNMDYVPDDFRIHANFHFINAIGRDGDGYVVSDAYFPELGRLSRRSMELGRFARGDARPRGFLFYPRERPGAVPLEKAVRTGIRKACFLMVKIPAGPLGVRGIRKFADQIVRWPSIAGSEEKLGRELLWFAISMEDMGTGGAGFRYMYATFLQEAAEVLHKPHFLELAEEMRLNGDAWREITVRALRMGREKDFSASRFADLQGRINERADFETRFFQALRKEV